MNKFLERISLLTEQDLIKWKKTSSNIRKYTIRFVGVGIKHKFVYIKSAKQRYAGYCNKFITDAQTEWEFFDFDNYELDRLNDIIYNQLKKIKLQQLGFREKIDNKAFDIKQQKVNKQKFELSYNALHKELRKIEGGIKC